MVKLLVYDTSVGTLAAMGDSAIAEHTMLVEHIVAATDPFASD